MIYERLKIKGIPPLATSVVSVGMTTVEVITRLMYNKFKILESPSTIQYSYLL